MTKRLFFVAVLLPAVVTAGECPPELKTFHIFERTGKQFGCLDHWQQTFFLELGCPLSFVDGNPVVARKEIALQNNQIQLITGLVQSPKRQYQFSAAFAFNRSLMYRRKDDPRWDQISSWCDPIMQQATIIAMSGLYIGAQVERLRHDKNCSKWFIESPRGLEHSFSLLDGKRADLLISPELYLRRLPAAEQAKYMALHLPVDTGELRIAFSTAIPPEFITRVNQLIENRRAEQHPLCDMDTTAATTN